MAASRFRLRNRASERFARLKQAIRSTPADRGEQQEQPAARRPDDVLRQRLDRARQRDGPPPFPGGDGAGLRLQHVELGARLIEAHALTQPSDRIVVVIADPADRDAQRDDHLECRR